MYPSTRWASSRVADVGDAPVVLEQSLHPDLVVAHDVTGELLRANGRSSSWGTTWLTSPSRSAASAVTKLPVSDISIHRGRPIHRASNTVMPPPGMIPTHTWVSAKHALRHDQERALQRELEFPAGDRHSVDRTDHRLRDHRDEPVEAVRVPLGSLAGATGSIRWVGVSPLTSFRSTPALNAGSAPVRTTTSISGSSPAAPTASHTALPSAAQRVARSGTVEGDGSRPGRRRRRGGPAPWNLGFTS